MVQRKSGRSDPHYYSSRLKKKLAKLCFAPAAIVEAPSGYGKTVKRPLEYYYNNVAETLILCDVMRKYGVKDSTWAAPCEINE